MRGRVVVNDGVIEMGHRVIVERSLRSLVNVPHWGRTYLGIGRRPPIMANGQVPGVRRQYDTKYALVLAEQLGPVALHDTYRSLGILYYGTGRNTRADVQDAIRRAMGEDIR